ncbi:hypothetical protein CMO93_03755 [Candidatus Woesearchaeota archaeon]|nr:hypothetical protein [Candidatus Woesearchaeota archaeon]|tara:strand:- start:1639 stop:2202 length:564 start_codon:yes stop_codon:yes gene_type:complete
MVFDIPSYGISGFIIIIVAIITPIIFVWLNSILKKKFPANIDFKKAIAKVNNDSKLKKIIESHSNFEVNLFIYTWFVFLAVIFYFYFYTFNIDSNSPYYIFMILLPIPLMGPCMFLAEYISDKLLLRKYPNIDTKVVTIYSSSYFPNKRYSHMMPNVNTVKLNLKLKNYATVIFIISFIIATYVRFT